MNLIPSSLFLPAASDEPAVTNFSPGVYLLSDGEKYLGLGHLSNSPQGLVWKLQQGGTLPASQVQYWGHLMPAQVLVGNREDHSLLDEDGYPTSYADALLSSWPWTDPLGWLRLAESIWHLGGYGFSIEETETGFTAHVSCLGWSGNEQLISAMKKNHLLWQNTWKSSRRGGHFEFVHETKAD